MFFPCDGQAKTGLGAGGDELRRGLFAVIHTGLTHATSPALRCAAAEALGRLAQAATARHGAAAAAAAATSVDFTNESIQSSFDKLKSSRDAARCRRRLG